MTRSAEKYIALLASWVGLKESDGSFKKIIDTYNSHKPLARGYKLSYNDPWCAAAVSAAAISCGYTDIIPTEVSCDKMITLAKEKGIWIENENVTPKPGWLVLYDWDDNGKGDNLGYPDHIGAVETVNGYKLTILEGNYNNAVGRRTLEVNGKYIRGYIAPKYDNEEAEKEAPAQKEPDAVVSKEEILAALGDQYITTYDELPEWAKPEVREMLDAGFINGGTTADKDPDDIHMLLSAIRCLIVAWRMVKAIMAKGATDAVSDALKQCLSALQKGTE